MRLDTFEPIGATADIRWNRRKCHQMRSWNLDLYSKKDGLRMIDYSNFSIWSRCTWSGQDPSWFAEMDESVLWKSHEFYNFRLEETRIGNDWTFSFSNLVWENWELVKVHSNPSAHAIEFLVHAHSNLSASALESWCRCTKSSSNLQQFRSSEPSSQSRSPLHRHRPLIQRPSAAQRNSLSEQFLGTETRITILQFRINQLIIRIAIHN